MGAVVPAAAVAALQMNLRAFITTLEVTGAHALLLGVPAALIYRQQGWRHPVATVAGGFLIGALPIGSVIALGAEKSTSLRWLLSVLEVVAACGGLGALGAAAFWLVLKISGTLR